MNNITQLTELLGRLPYAQTNLDTEDGFKVALQIADASVVVFWNPESNNYEVEFPVVEGKVVCGNTEQLEKMLTVFAKTKEDNFTAVVQMINDAFCTTNGIAWKSTLSNVEYTISDEDKLDVKVLFSENMDGDKVVVDVKPDYFVVSTANAVGNFRYDLGKNTVVKLPNLETCMVALNKMQEQNPGMFTIEQGDISENIVLNFNVDGTEYVVEFQLGLCASSFLFETMYVNDTEVYLDFPFKNPNQIFEYRDTCINKYNEVIALQAEKEEAEKQERLEEVKSAFETLAQHIFSVDGYTADFVSATPDYVNYHIVAGSNELNLIWSVDAELPYSFELNYTESTVKFVSVVEMEIAIESELAKIVEPVEPVVEETVEEEPTFEEVPVAEETTSDIPVVEDEVPTQNEFVAEESVLDDTPWGMEETPIPVQETGVFGEAPLGEEANDFEPVAAVPNADDTFEEVPVVEQDTAQESVVAFDGSVRMDEVLKAETEIREIMNRISATEFMLVIGKLLK